MIIMYFITFYADLNSNVWLILKSQTANITFIFFRR